tara:strand:- start:5106 stop:5501 length:396 start_codon:yes stop_codon:yes gene_type:complete
MSKTTTTLENGTTIEITESNNTITVEAEVPRRALATQEKVTCNNSTITETLKNAGIEVGSLISGTTISNSKSDTELNGRWTFEAPRTTTTTKKTTTKKTTTKRTTRTTGGTKTTKAKKEEEVSKSGTDKLL